MYHQNWCWIKINSILINHLIAGGLDVHGAEDTDLDLHRGAVGSDSGVPYARNSGQITSGEHLET